MDEISKAKYKTMLYSSKNYLELIWNNKNMILGLPIIQIKQIIWENINTGKYVIQEE